MKTLLFLQTRFGEYDQRRHRTVEKTSALTAAAPVRAAHANLVKQVLKTYMAQFASVSDAELEQMLALVKVREYRAGACLVREGQVCNKCYFVLKGCIRQFYIVDGIEKTTNFYTEGQPISSTFNYNKRPSKFWIYCNEDCVVIEGTPEDELNFLAQMPEFEPLIRIGVEHELENKQQSFAEFMLNSPEERYLNLLDTRPDLLDRVPQYQLASYLGVTPESLSRIRKRISKSKAPTHLTQSQ